MMDNKEQLHVVTEVGVFDELDVNDPTAKKVKKDGEEDSSDVALEQPGLDQGDGRTSGMAGVSRPMEQDAALCRPVGQGGRHLE